MTATAEAGRPAARKSRRGWLQAAAELEPKLDFGGLLALRRRLARLCPDAAWEGGVGTAAGLGVVTLRLSAEPARYASRLPALREALGLGDGPALAAPPAGTPWCSVTWDARAGKRVSASVTGLAAASGGAPALVAQLSEGGAPERLVRVSRSPFRLAALGGPEVQEPFRRLTDLFPARALVSESDVDATGRLTPRSAWALVAAEPVPLPLVLRLDAAAGFAPHSSVLCVALLNRPVTELGFREEGLWVFFRG